ncbi:hypothetical protein GIB67_021016 [Kingdonia uniflora]|uniref:Thioredoxin domain-containing protein n=1 Tax=Kingdonia uniflora TaxID=39325 RepID=A0A7J7N6V0_9MAGN|nr:hypothetical protein GIB67_021016 [Kingdonia uniflora]
MVPVLEQVSATLKDKIQVVKIDTEKYTSIASKYNIEALPTFIIFKDGKPFDRFEIAANSTQSFEVENPVQHRSTVNARNEAVVTEIAIRGP